MKQRKTHIILLAVMVLVGAGIGTAVATGSGTPASQLPPIAKQTEEAQAPVSRALPGASATLTASPEGEGSILSVSVSRASFHQPASNVTGFAAPTTPGERAEAFEAGEAGWRTQMAAAYAASRNPTILGWSLSPTEGTVSAEATNLLHGVLRTATENPIGWPSETKIGSVGEKAAIQQLESNIAVLKNVTGEVITNSAIEAVPIGAAPATFGLQVDLRVHNLSELAPHIGDVFLGLGTGLVGTPQAAVEGLAINVVDDSGARASVWMNGRAGDGSALGTSEALNPSNAHTTDATFPVLDGGPESQDAANGNGPNTHGGGRAMPHAAKSALP